MTNEELTAIEQRALEILEDEGVESLIEDGGDMIADLLGALRHVRADNTALHRVAAAAIIERWTRAAWLGSLPAGSCTNPPPQALIDAEEATGRALAEVTRE